MSPVQARRSRAKNPALCGVLMPIQLWERRSHMSGIHFGLPADMESHVCHVWIPAFAGMTWDEVVHKCEYLKRTHFSGGNTGKGFQGRSMDLSNMPIVNAQGDPTDTVRLKRSQLGQSLWVADDVLSEAEGRPRLPLLSPGTGHTGTCAAHKKSLDTRLRGYDRGPGNVPM